MLMARSLVASVWSEASRTSRSESKSRFAWMRLLLIATSLDLGFRV